MSNIKLANNATTFLISDVTDSTTTFSVEDGSVFPSLDVSEYFYATLQAALAPSVKEIVKVVGVAGDIVTVVRGAEGSSPLAFADGSLLEQRLTAATLYDLTDTSGLENRVSQNESAIGSILTEYLPKSGGILSGDIVFGDGVSAPPQEVFLAPTVAGGWARGTLFKNKAGTTLGGIVGLGNGSSLDSVHMGIGTSPWTAASSFMVTATDIKYKNYNVWHSGNDGSGSGLEADLLDGLHASSFVKTDGSTATLQSGNTSSPMDADSVTGNALVYTTTDIGSTNDGALYSQAYSSIWVHQISGDYRTGDTYVRGKNNGTWQPWRKQWNSGNDGSGSGLDADLLDGLHGNASYDTFTAGYVRRHSSGYIYSNYFNMTANSSTTTASRVAIENSSDGFLRWQSLANFAARMPTVPDSDKLGGYPASNYSRVSASNVWTGYNTFNGGSLTISGAWTYIKAASLSYVGTSPTDRFYNNGTSEPGYWFNLSGNYIGLKYRYSDRNTIHLVGAVGSSSEYVYDGHIFRFSSYITTKILSVQHFPVAAKIVTSQDADRWEQLDQISVNTDGSVAFITSRDAGDRAVEELHINVHIILND